MSFPKQRLAGWMRWALFGAPILPVLWRVGDFITLRGARYSDLAITHYPNAIYLIENLRQGILPLWSNTILSGYPFAANPLAGLWYPPGWLALIFQLPLGFNLMTATHLVWAGVGMYFLLTAEGKSRLAGTLGGLMYASLPKLLAHTGAGHLTLVYAVCWTPWLLWAEQRWSCQPGRRRFWRAPGVILGVVILADVRWAFYAGLLWVGYAIRQMVSERRLLGGVNGFWKRAGGLAAQVGLNVLSAAGIGAILLIPLLELVSLSSRSALNASDVFALSLPPGNLLGLLFPNLGSGAEWTLYLGASFLLVVLATFNQPGKQKPWFWAGVWVVSLILALGNAIPGMVWLAKVPGFSLLRVPARVLFINGLAGSALAAEYLHRIMAQGGLPRQRVFNLALAGLTLLAVLLAGGVWLVNGKMEINFTWAAVVLCGFVLLTVFNRRGILSQRSYAVTVGTLLLLDVVGMNFLSLEGHARAEVLAEGQAAATAMTGQRDLYRVYSPSYSIPQQTAMLKDLELADGVDPLSLRTYAAFMGKASGVAEEGYSVTIPTFRTGTPETDNANGVPNVRLLGWLNVRYVSAEFDLPADGLALMQQTGKTRIYRNLEERPRAWMQAGASISDDYVDGVTIEDYQANRITVSANGPGVLVLSEILYPGWMVTVDGTPMPMIAVEQLLRGVELAGGTHQVVFSFRPVSVYAGMAGTVTTLFMVVLASVNWRRRVR